VDILWKYLPGGEIKTKHSAYISGILENRKLKYFWQNAWIKPVLPN